MKLSQIIHFPLPLQYAFRGLVYLSSKPLGEIYDIEEIAKAENLPPDFLGKLFQKLCTVNILDSKRGPGGGYSLLKPANKILLLDIVRIFVSEQEKRSCLFGLGVCGEVANCPLHTIMKSVESKLEIQLQKLTLQDLKRTRDDMLIPILQA